MTHFLNIGLKLFFTPLSDVNKLHGKKTFDQSANINMKNFDCKKNIL